MTRTLPTGVSTAATAFGYRAHYAVEIALASPIRVTDCPQGLTIGGDSYAYGSLGVGDAGIDEHPALSILLANADNAITSVDLANLTIGALDGIGVTVYEVHFSALGVQLDPVTLLANGAIVGYTADEAAIHLIVQSAVDTSAGMVGRICTRSCGYVFKGARCGYAGAATSCAHSLAACTALSNTGRFGGYQTMPTLGTRLSYWVTQYVPPSTRYGLALPVTQPVQTSPAPAVRPHVTRQPSSPNPGGAPTLGPDDLNRQPPGGAPIDFTIGKVGKP